MDALSHIVPLLKKEQKTDQNSHKNQHTDYAAPGLISPTVLVFKPNLSDYTALTALAKGMSIHMYMCMYARFTILTQQICKLDNSPPQKKNRDWCGILLKPFERIQKARGEYFYST